MYVYLIDNNDLLDEIKFMNLKCRDIIRENGDIDSYKRWTDLNLYLIGYCIDRNKREIVPVLLEYLKDKDFLNKFSN